MNGQRFLEIQAAMINICEHDDTCDVCRDRRLGAAVAKEMLEAGDSSDETCIYRWAEEWSRRHTEAFPSMNVTQHPGSVRGSGQES